MSIESAAPTGLRKYAMAAFLAAVLLVIGAVAMMSSDKTAIQSYLMGWLFWMLLALGCLGLTLLHHTIRPTWSLSTMRLYEAGGSWVSFVLLFLAGLPIFTNLSALYKWTNHEVMHESKMLQYKTWYLNESSFTIRQVVYLLLWAGIAFWMRRSSLEQDKTLNDRAAAFRSSASAVILPVYVISLTMAVTDWIMSLDLKWFSSIFGAWLMVGAVLTTIALTNLIVLRNSGSEPYKAIINRGLTKDLGNMMFVFTLLWAYTSVSQFIIIWQGNLSEFISFFVIRSQGGWDKLALVLIVGQFLIPFILLMSPKLKATPRLLMGMCVWVLAMRLIDFFWIVAPFMRTGNVEVHLLPDLLCFAAMGAVWAFAFLSQLGQGALIPIHDKRLQEAYHHA
ncbi:MAG: hypothetical protein HZC36_11140 [Armatimonadetes bacterium]|nr:hypothetical protein [Armatimonadota bacterium]